MNTKTDDRDLIAHILSRDRHALSVFYRTYTPKLRSHIRNRVSSAEDAEEILQDTLFAFLEAIRDFSGKASVKTFLFAICGHKIIDYYRRKKLKSVVFSRSPGLEALISPVLNPEQELDAKILTDKIHRALSRLLPHHRTALILKYMDTLSVSEVALKLNMTVKGAESQLTRARKAFMEIYRSI
jgi:RNA polymerase sigma-70 factor, ECF subfamily